MNRKNVREESFENFLTNVDGCKKKFIRNIRALDGFFLLVLQQKNRTQR